MKIYDKCPGCDESVLGRKPVTMFECRSWIGLDGVLTETNTCLRRQLTQSQAREQKLKTALAVIELSFAAMQERAEAAEGVVEKAIEIVSKFAQQRERTVGDGDKIKN